MNTKTKILYVDDEPINLQLFEINFEEKYNVLVAEDGHSGLTVLDNHQDTSVIISDMKMPEMNGVEFVRKAKSKYPAKKYMILTGYDITEDIKEALQSGLILKYLQKPFVVEQIESAIEKCVV